MGKNILGKLVYLELEEVVRPERTVIVVIDMQNDFCTPGGHYDRCGRNISYADRIAPHIAGLILKARELNVPVIYVQNTGTTEGAYFAPATVAHYLKRWKDESKICFTIDKTWGHEVIQSLKPKEKDLMVKKHRPSAFTGTDLDQIIRSSGRETIIITGVVTEGCIESTAREGWLRDYYIVIAEDCIGSSKPDLHEAQLKLMKEIYHFVVSSAEILFVWDSKEKNNK
jgi:nicotinamidase-related amidase